MNQAQKIVLDCFGQVQRQGPKVIWPLHQIHCSNSTTFWAYIKPSYTGAYHMHHLWLMYQLYIKIRVQIRTGTLLKSVQTSISGTMENQDK